MGVLLRIGVPINKGANRGKHIEHADSIVEKFVCSLSTCLISTEKSIDVTVRDKRAAVKNNSETLLQDIFAPRSSSLLPSRRMRLYLRAILTVTIYKSSQTRMKNGPWGKNLVVVNLIFRNHITGYTQPTNVRSSPIGRVRVYEK